MNIVKFLDKIKTDDEYFNENIKGKYTYLIRWTYVVTLESITEAQYIDMEKNGITDDSITFYLLDDVQDYVDLTATESVNDVDKYKVLNKYVTDPEITLDELKKFRTWLAQYLLMFDQGSDDDQKNEIYTDDQTHMLLYYANGMYDDVVKYLGVFGDSTLSFSTATSTCGCNASTSYSGKTTITYGSANVSKSTCSCSNSSAATLSALTNVSTCDPLAVYKKNIYAKMVETFSEIDFWTQFSSSFISDIKKYIDGIINYNLPLYTVSYISNYADCGCLSEADSEQQTNLNVLRKLSSALQYMIDGEVSGHKNAIAEALSQWSSLLYERMYWA